MCKVIIFAGTTEGRQIAEFLRGRGSRAAVRSKETRWETTGTKRRGSNPPRENDRPAALLQMGGGL